jgi:hypothetical protein
MLDSMAVSVTWLDPTRFPGFACTYPSLDVVEMNKRDGSKDSRMVRVPECESNRYFGDLEPSHAVATVIESDFFTTGNTKEAFGHPPGRLLPYTMVSL